MLYSGGFFSDGDRRKMAQLRDLPPHKLASIEPRFDDPRLPEILFRYRARNFPETLTGDEHERWEQFRRLRLSQPGYGASLVHDEFLQVLDRLEQEPDLSGRDRTLLAELRAYGRELLR